MARKKLTFENAMETLEEIVNQLEAGDIPLNELIDKMKELGFDLNDNSI